MQVSKISDRETMSNVSNTKNRQKQNSKPAFKMAFSEKMQARLAEDVFEILEEGVKSEGKMFETIKYISNHPITVCLDSEVKVPILLNKDGLVHPVNTSGKDIIVHQLNMTAEELKAYDKLVSETSSGSEVKALLEQKSEVINKRDANKPFLVKQLLNGEIKTEDVPKIKESREVSIQEEGQIEQKIKEHEEDEAKLANFFQNKTNFLYF